MYNSPLSENAPLGFEYGYSVQSPTVLVVWVLWGYKMGFGSPLGGGSPNVYKYKYTGNFFANFFNNFVGHPQSINAGHAQIGQAALPVVPGAVGHAVVVSPVPG